MGVLLDVAQKILLWIVHGFLMSLFYGLKPVFSWYFEPDRSKLLPAITDNVLLKSATELANMIRNKQVSSVSVLDSYIARIRAVNPIVNAMVEERFDEALAEARQVDRILSQSSIPDEYSADRKPMLGVPFSAKVAFAVKGMPNNGGLLQRATQLAQDDAESVAAMRDAGAIPLALTNCSELCMWYESSNLVYGRTNNAYHPGRMVGGSSGGEGSLLASAGSVIGIGSDIGGSIRMPAFFNGIFGHKGTHGIVSNEGQFPHAQNLAENYLTTGPMCRYAADLTLGLKAMAQPKALTKLKLDQSVDVSKLRCFYMVDDGGSFLVTGVDPQLKQSVIKVVEHFKGLGVTCEQLCIKEMVLSLPIWSTLMQTSGDAAFASLMADGQDMSLFGEFCRWLIQKPRHTLPAMALGLMEKFPVPPEQVEYMTKQCDSLKQQIQDKLGDNGFLLYPPHPQVALYHNQALTAPLNFAYTAIWNVVGVPITSVPLGISHQGVPLGVQVIANYWQDHISIAVAQELEKAFGGWIQPPSA